MPKIDSDLEHRVDRLTAEVQELHERVEALSLQVAGVVSSAVLEPGQMEAFVERDRAEEQPAGATEAAAPGEKLTTETALSHVATITFLLVVALILRLLVDREIVEQRLGTVLGIFYTGSLIAYGFYRHQKSAFVFPVYSVSGTLLLFSIVYETHARFEWLSAPIAYSLLALAMAAMAAMSMRYRVALPVIAGVLGAVLTGLALGYPDLSFAWAAGLVFLANIAAYLAIRVPRARGVVWATLVATLFFWALWTAKLQQALRGGETAAPHLAQSWFFPAVALFASAYIAMVVWSVLRQGWSYPALERTLPVVNVLWAYLAARSVERALHGQEQTVAVAASLATALHIALAIAVARSKGEERPTTTFSIAAVILLALSLPAAVGDIRIALIIWSAAATGLAILSWVRENRLSRGLSYVFQVFVCGMALSSGAVLSRSPQILDEALVPFALAGSCILHYSWNRRRAPKPETGFFRSAAVLLILATVTYGFAVARTMLFQAMQSRGVESPDVFQFGQSFFLNGGALLLMFLALRRNNGEILGAAFLAALAGAAKVFGYDFTHVQDLPLVLSVFVFGVTAATGSIVWRRWRRQTDGEAPG